MKSLIVKVIEKYKKIQQERKEVRKRIDQRRESELALPEGYRSPIQYIKENCAFYEPKDYIGDGTGSAYPIYMKYGDKKTLDGLNQLSLSDKRTNDELVDWIEETRNLSSLGYNVLGVHSVLTDAVLAFRMSSDKTLEQCMLDEGVIGKTFVDWQDSLHPFMVKGLEFNRFDHFSIKTNYAIPDWRAYKQVDRDLLDSRELKSKYTELNTSCKDTPSSCEALNQGYVVYQ